MSGSRSGGSAAQARPAPSAVAWPSGPCIFLRQFNSVVEEVVHANAKHVHVALAHLHVDTARGGRATGDGQLRIAVAVEIVEQILGTHAPVRRKHPLITGAYNIARPRLCERSSPGLAKNVNPRICTDDCGGGSIFPRDAARDIRKSRPRRRP